MSGFSTYAEELVLDHVFNFSTLVPPATIYAALWVGDPTDSGAGGAEVTGGSYARIAVVNGAADFSRTLSQVTNDNPIQFPQATVAWGTVTHIAFFDAITVGNMWYSTPLAASRLVDIGDEPFFSAGSTNFNLD